MQDTLSPNQELQNPIIQPKFSHVKFANNFLIIIMLVYITSGVAVEIFLPLPHGKFIGYIEGLSQLFLMLLPALLFSRYSTLPFKTLFRLESLPGLKKIIISVIGVVVLSIFDTSFTFLQEKLVPDFLLEAYKSTEKSIEQLYTQILGGSGFLAAMKALLIGAIIPSVTEETLFRGFYQRSLEEELKPYLAILITGIIFAVVHLNPINFIPLIFIGLYLGVVAYGTRSLLIPILIHFLHNAVAVVIMYIPSLSLLDEQSYNLTITSSIILSIISFAVLAFISMVIYKSAKN
ncbi:MAG: CPBP family intramembrane metalloprotease [Bacteroidetes bacterium]|nr:CPBP family intramembrane metalloprotease [Bacteroidota bacterium]